MMNNKKSLVLIKVVDAFGYAIPKAQYQVKNQKTGQVIAAGATNSAGCIVEISRDKGTVLDVYIKSMFNGLMLNVKSFTMSKDRMLVTVASPKILLDLKTLTTQGSNGAYRRKTHTVKKGETLTSIAQQYGTTVRALERLNKIDDPDKISVAQVIKLPVNIPATGSNAHYDKPKAKPTSKPTTTQKPKVTSAPKSKPPQASTDVWGTITGVGGEIADAIEKNVAELEKKYEEGKKALGEIVGSVKIPTILDRSQEVGTPKTNVTNSCKTSPQCISSGKSELIREVNIRLAGFGGALPSDEFTDLTAKCIKQFQRDYMGVTETGKICGSVLIALDRFNLAYPIDAYLSSLACPCSKYGGGDKCNGFGASRTHKYSKAVGVEAPGMHRSTLWILKAFHFYLEKHKELGVKIKGISSGYRCIENNAGHNSSRKVRSTVNHMGGAAIDVLINDNNKLDIIRNKIFIKYMNASPVGTRGENQIFLESAAQSATSWIHFDILWYDAVDVKCLNQYGTTTSKIVNGSISELFKKDKSQILSCGGLIVKSEDKKVPGSTLDKNIKAFLDTIAKSEGTIDLGDNGYNVMVTGKIMKDYKNHPFTHNDKALHVRGSLYSSASGRYQIMRDNWYGAKGQPKTGLQYQLGLNDFSPRNQDVAAIALLKRRKAYDLILKGKINTAFRTTTLRLEWASFPGAGYNQQEHKMTKILKWYQDFGGVVTD